MKVVNIPADSPHVMSGGLPWAFEFPASVPPRTYMIAWDSDAGVHVVSAIVGQCYAMNRLTSPEGLHALPRTSQILGGLCVVYHLDSANPGLCFPTPYGASGVLEVLNVIEGARSLIRLGKSKAALESGG